MADDARQPPPDLSALQAPVEGFDFFELLRRLEASGRLFGRGPRPEAEPARLGQQVRLGFAVTDVARFEPGSAGGPARVTVANLGLLGPEGPLPLHLTRWVLDRLSQRWFAGQDARETSDTTFVDFANILQHRAIALYFRAWADAHPAVQVERATGGRVRAMLAALAGIGLPGTGGGPKLSDLDLVKLRQAAALASQVEGPERLTAYLAEAFRVPVRLKEFVAAWIPVPVALQSSLGRAHAGLGRGAAIGPRAFGRQNRIEIRLGSLDLETYKAFLPGGERLQALKRAVRELVGGHLDVDVRLALAEGAVPKARLGQARLGQTSWLPRKPGAGDAEDMRLRVAVGWRLDPQGAMA